MPQDLGYAIFSLFSQAVVGMVLYIFFAYSRIESSTRLLQGKTALVMLGTGGLAFAAISDGGSIPRNIWVNREILCLLFMGVLLAVWLSLRRKFLIVAASFLGLTFIYIMSKAAPFTAKGLLKSYTSLSIFASGMLLLGPATLFFIACLKNRDDAGGLVRQILSWQPMAISLAFVLRMLVTLVQSISLENTPLLASKLVWIHAGMLLLGAGPMLLLIIRSPFTPTRDETGRFSYRGLFSKVSVMTALIWCSEFMDRLALR